MLHSTNQTQSDILNTQSSGEETHKQNSNLILHEPIARTPFTITTVQMGELNKQQYFLRMGDYRLSEIGNSKKEILDELEKENWNIILKMIAVVIQREIHEGNVTNFANSKPSTNTENNL